MKVVNLNDADKASRFGTEDEEATDFSTSR
jgi:hypothetical protein